MTAKKNNRRHKRNRRAFVLKTLRGRIVDGFYPQGMKLVEQELAEEFKMSRPMLREILADLDSQGLVEKKANRGTMVRRIDSQSLLEIMEIREVLEGLAARLAAQKTDPQDWQDLEAAFGDPAGKMVEDLEFEKYLELVAKLRERMVDSAGNTELSKLIYSLFAKITVVQRRIVILPGRIEQAINEHRQVLKALIAGDPDKAEKMKRLNLRNARKCLEKYKSYVS
ncbi:MAG: GntR family transcriptional regulator [Desulfobacterales bacterium]|jgi:DNA-binding GntR family transcriptional regulator